MGTCLWYVTNLPLWLLQKPVLRVPTRTSDRMSQWFPMNNIRLYLLIDSSLVRLQRVCISHLRAKRASNGSCCLLKISTSICSPRCALTTVHQSFLCLWDSITGPHEEFLTKKYSSLSLFAYKVHGYLLWENLAAFQALQLCSSPTCEQKRFVWPCSKLPWLCLSCK